MTDKQLMREVEREEQLMTKRGFVLPIHLTPGAALSIVGCLQLALRHPENIGPVATVARAAIDGIRTMFAEFGYAAHVEIIAAGEREEIAHRRRSGEAVQ